MLTQLWFVINICFVALFIWFLFASRSWQIARQSGDTANLPRLRRRRVLIGLLAFIAFLAMSVVFLINMNVNG